MTRHTRGDFGIAVASPHKEMKNGRWLNDTRKTKWAVDIDRNPSHLQIIDNLGGGTKWVLASDAAYYIEETLFVMKHNMPFPPQFLCYFYTKNSPAGYSANIGRYTQNKAFMLFNAIGLGEEGLYAQVDDEYFYIKHFAETFAFGAAGSNTNFFGDDYTFRVRFALLNQPAFFTGDKGY